MSLMILLKMMKKDQNIKERDLDIVTSNWRMGKSLKKARTKKRNQL